MLRILLSLCLFTAVSSAQASFGVKGWNDLTVNGQGSSRVSSPSYPPIVITGQSMQLKLDTHWRDAGRPVLLVLGAGHSIVPGAFAVGFGQCTTIDIGISSIASIAVIGKIPNSGPFTTRLTLPLGVYRAAFSVQAAVNHSYQEYFLSQAHAVTVRTQ